MLCKDLAGHAIVVLKAEGQRAEGAALAGLRQGPTFPCSTPVWRKRKGQEPLLWGSACVAVGGLGQ